MKATHYLATAAMSALFVAAPVTFASLETGMTSSMAQAADGGFDGPDEGFGGPGGDCASCDGFDDPDFAGGGFPDENEDPGEETTFDFENAFGPTDPQKPKEPQKAENANTPKKEVVTRATNFDDSDSDRSTRELARKATKGQPLTAEQQNDLDVKEAGGHRALAEQKKAERTKAREEAVEFAQSLGCTGCTASLARDGSMKVEFDDGDYVSISGRVVSFDTTFSVGEDTYRGDYVVEFNTAEEAQEYVNDIFNGDTNIILDLPDEPLGSAVNRIKAHGSAISFKGSKVIAGGIQSVS